VSLPEPLGSLVAFGLVLLLIMLRLDAERFGAAEYDEVRDGHTPPLRRRLGWYAIGLGLVVAILLIHPDPAGQLFLQTGDRLRALAWGFVYAAIGAAQAVGFAWWRYRRVRLPTVSSYPGALLNELGTAFIDEAAFRGAMLGLILSTGVDPRAGVVLAAIVYALATRTGAPGRRRYMLVLALGVGLVGGWMTVETGGIAAAFIGHTVTRFSVFLCTGHAGQPEARGREIEEIEKRRRPPDGWRVIGSR
jgi:CAAX prenyl protease-like protein